MNRRGFLGFLGAAIAGATLDKDRFLWEPGKKLISIPTPPVGISIRYLRGYDVREGRMIERLDVLYGFGAKLPILDDVYGVYYSDVTGGTNFDEGMRLLNRTGRGPIHVPEKVCREFRKPIPEHRVVILS